MFVFPQPARDQRDLNDLVNLARAQKFALKQRRRERFDLVPVLNNRALGLTQQALPVLHINKFRARSKSIVLFSHEANDGA